MTEPRQARRRQGRDAPRTYAWPPLPPHEFEVISVTSAKDVLPKPWLVGWAAKMTAIAGVEDHAIVGAMLAKGDEQAAIDHLKGARYRDSGAKANRGTVVHAALESYLAGKELTAEDLEAQLKERRVPLKLWKSTGLMVKGLMEFLVDEEPEVYWSETTVYSRTHGYAGTPDIIARMRVGGALVPVVIDVKTSKDIYDDTSLQTCAYARADFVGLDDGTEKQLTPDGEPIDFGVVVRPTPDGRYQKRVCAHTDELYELFLGCLAVANAQGVEKEVWRPS